MKSIPATTLRTILVGAALTVSAYIPQATAAPLTSADYVTVGTNQWAQASLFDGVSWNDVASACSATTGTCSGSLKGYDLTGWTWASQLDAANLFNTYLPASAALAGPNSYVSPLQSTTAQVGDAVFNAGFAPTFPVSDPATNYAFLALTRTDKYYGLSATPVTAYWQYSAQTSTFQAVVAAGAYSPLYSNSVTDSNGGALFYRVAPVPAPPALALFGSGLMGIGMGAIRRKKKGRNS